MRLPLAIVLLFTAIPVLAHDAGWAGRYELREGPDVAGGLELTNDGHFAFGIAAGALDEQAQGRWEADGDAVLLTTEPRPKAPVFSLKSESAGKASAPISLKVEWPGGRGVSLVDFRIGIAGGDPLEGNTQDYGWSAEPDKAGNVSWIELSHPIPGMAPRRFAVTPGSRAFTFLLTPNDAGVADFDHARLIRDGDHLSLPYRGGSLSFVPAN